MSRPSFIVFLTLCVSVYFVHGVEAVPVDDPVLVDDPVPVEDPVEAGAGVYEIIEGECDTALAKDLLYKEHVSKVALPFVAREATSSWSGVEKIYCLKVLNDKAEADGSNCEVTKGGIGFDHVTIEMHSKANHGLEFDIEVYANTATAESIL